MSVAQELKEIKGTLRNRREQLSAMFAKKTADGRLDWQPADRDKFKALEAECAGLEVKATDLRTLAVAEKKNADELKKLNTPRIPGSFSGSRGGTRQTGSANGDGADHMDGMGYKARPRIGDYFIESKAFKGRKSGRDFGITMSDFEAKTLFATAAGFDPFVPRQNFIALSPQQKPKVVDLLPTSETQFHSIKWMLETLYTNAADATAEGGLYPEAALQFTEQMSPVQKVSVFLPVTDEQLDDVPRMRDTLNNRLELMLRQRLDQLALNGNGTAPQLLGLFNIAGIQTQAKGADPVPSAIHKAMTNVAFVGFADPTGVIMNPMDWQGVLLLQTADGLYIYGHPSQPTVSRIWGLPVVTTTYCAQGSALVGDYQQHTELFWRKGVEFLVSNSHADFFARGQQAVRADLRVGLICTRPKALCSVTGIPLS